MSYSVKQREASFAIPKENYPSACRALRHFLEHKCYAEYVQHQNVISACKNGDLVKALFYCRWTCTEDSSGIIGISFNQSKLGNDYEIFCSISKYVQDGSYIVVEGEDRHIFRWCFINGQCLEENGRFLHETDPLYTVVCDWVSSGESGVAVLCSTPDIGEARRVLEENIKTEKCNSWISAVATDDIGASDDCSYCEEKDEDSWSFYKKGFYQETHTTIKIYEYAKEI